MIDTTREHMLTIKEAAAHFKKHRKTIYDWAQPFKANNEPKQFWLETVIVGASLMTSLEACQRFTERCSQGRRVVSQVAMTIPQHVSEERIRKSREALKANHG